MNNKEFELEVTSAKTFDELKEAMKNIAKQIDGLCDVESDIDKIKERLNMSDEDDN
jgi:hypothetical protein